MVVAEGLSAECGSFALVSAGENMPAFVEHGRDSLTPIYPVSSGKDPEFFGLAKGGGAKDFYRLKLAVEVCADWS